MKVDEIKIGDLLYAVGPGHHAPHSASDLCVYSTPVKNVRIDSEGTTDRTPVIAIELNDDRPVLGFPQWIYKGYDVGIKVHRSAADALRAFTVIALARADEAERARERHYAEARWALAQTTESH